VVYAKLETNGTLSNKLSPGFLTRM